MKKILLEVLKVIAEGVISSSYIICLTVAMVAIIFYIAGQKKAGKYVSIAIIVYVLLEALKGTLIR